MVKIKKEDIILGAFIECITDYHIQTRKEVKESGEIVRNPHFYEQGQFVSLDYIDPYNNIIYRKTQPGVDPTEPNFTIGVAHPYAWYKPYHDKWMRPINIDKKLDELFG